MTTQPAKIARFLAIWKNPVLLIGLGLTLVVAIAGVLDTQGLGRVADDIVQTAFATYG